MQRGFFIDPKRGQRPGAEHDAEMVYSYQLSKEEHNAPPAGWYWRYTGKGASKDGINGPYPSKEAGERACREEHGTDMVEYLELYDRRTDLWRERLV